MKIYTKTGDKGTTSLIGGKRVPKYHIRIEAYGTVDELIAHIGLIRDSVADEHYHEVLVTIQDHLMICASELATDKGSGTPVVPLITEEDIQLLENEIDAMDEELPDLTSFVLPGGHPIVSYCHIARTVCRRAERCALSLSEAEEVSSAVLKYLNRLSDYLFMLSRKLGKDLNADEISWKPRL